jgi:hypothetical protein
MKGIDCCAQITPEFAQELVNQGVFYVARYLVPEYPSLIWKRLTSQESQVCTNYNLKIMSIFELDVGDTKGGSESGIYHGQLAYNEAKIVGQPEGSGICFTVDYEATEEDYNTIEAYLLAAKSQLPGYKIGCYGHFFVVEEMLKRGACDFGWQCAAWSNGNVPQHDYCLGYQYGYNEKIFGIDVDINDFYIGLDNPLCWNYGSQEVIIEESVETPIEIITEEIQVEQPEIVSDWKVEAMKYLKDNGYIESDHDPDEPMSFCIFGQIMKNKGW